MQNISSAVEAILTGQRRRSTAPADHCGRGAADSPAEHSSDATAPEELVKSIGAIPGVAAATPESADGDLESFLARVLGWDNRGAIERALSSIDLAVDGRVALVLRGADDLVSIAWSLHRRALGSDRPFIVCDPRRGDLAPCVRSPANRKRLDMAIAAATGGALCVRTRRLPPDFGATVARLRDARDVMLILCRNEGDDDSPLLVRPAPVVIPPLTERGGDLSRIIDEYAHDAAAQLGVSLSTLTADDRTWVHHHAASSLPEIEKTTLRLMALRVSRTPSEAAARLGMEPVSLCRWLRRREAISDLAVT
jgi:hypothetical protein